jgi:glycosyltransferase involved in cell wall biosynthesis
VNDTTVVITCFNYGRYVGEAVESARTQARVLVVDDGSTDAETQRVLDELPEDVDVIRQRNAGVAAARNVGLAAATTPYLLCLDADDRLASGAVEVLQRTLNDHIRLGFSYGWMRFFGDWNWTWRLPPYDPYKLLHRHQIGLSALMRREVFEATGGFDPSFEEFEDWELWLNALVHGFRGERVPAVTLEYRKHGLNKQHADRQHYRAMYRKARRKHAELYAQAGELAQEAGVGWLTRGVYRWFWGARPLPATLEKRLQARAWGVGGRSTGMASL